MAVFIIIVFAIIIVLQFKRFCIPDFIDSWRKEIKVVLNRIKNEGVKENIRPKTKAKIEDSLEHVWFMEKRRVYLNSFTRLVSWVEFIIFALLTFLTLQYGNEILEKLKLVVAFLGGWLAIKVFVSHKAWEDPIVGKDYYETSLLGTLLNTVAGVIVGILFHQLIQLTII